MSPNPEEPVAVVGIGASAGGLEAFGDLLERLAPDTGMSFVFIQHLDPSHASMLTSLLSRRSPILVDEARQGMRYEANHAYVIPPNTLLTIEDGTLALEPRSAERGPPMPIDRFFRSMAEQLGDRAIGVVLSGTGSDGANGLLAIKAQGGVTFAQDEQTATYSGMPLAAVAAGAVDVVLPPQGIADEITRLARFPGTLPGVPGEESSGLVDGSSDLRRILALMAQATGADLGYYKPATLLRRLARRMLLVGVPSLAAYGEHVREHPAELAALHQDILINVTSFFRDAEMQEGLVEHVLPGLLKNRRPDDPIRIWVPGCSSGEEAYSIAIAVLEHSASANLNVPLQIFATDLSEPAVARCRAGLYGPELTLSPERLTRYFSKTDHGYQVSKTIRDLCIFARHNLLQDPPFSQIDLVSCRNLLIYLRPEYQRRAFEIFHYALKAAGYLMLGRSESIGGATELFSAVDKQTRVFARKPAARSPVHFAPRLIATPFPRRPEGAPDPARQLGDLIRLADAALEPHTPPAVVIDADGEVIHFRGNTRPYLTTPSGEPTSNLFRLTREPLRIDLRMAIEAARRGERPASRGPISLADDGRVRRVVLEVMPLATSEGPAGHFIVRFSEETEPALAATSSGQEALGAGVGGDTAQLKAELDQVRSQLESTIQELESLNEEYRSAHEEALSANEELQSANEELETAKEELQSTNEELTTVNDELQGRSAELNQTNNDLTNVLNSVQMPVILVGSDLRLRRFTPMATKVLNVIAGDVGRPISDLTLNVAIADLASLVVETMETMQPLERDVQDPQGRWYVMRVRPYRTHDHKIDGAVIMLVDVDELRRAVVDAREAQRFAEGIVTTVREPLVVLDDGFRVLTANRSFYEVFRLEPEGTLGRTFFEIGERQWNDARLRELLERILTGRSSFEGFEVTRELPRIGERSMVLNARLVDDGAGGAARILVAIEDVTDRRRVETEQRARLAASEHARTEAEDMGALLRRVEALVDTALLKLPFDDFLREVLERIRATLGGDTAVILLRKLPEEDGKEDDVLYARAAIGLDEDQRRQVRVPVGSGFAGRIAVEQEPLILGDVDPAKMVSPYFREKGIRALIGVPLLTEGGLLGVLHVGSLQPWKFGQKDVEILMLAAERIAHAVEVSARRKSEEQARAAAEAANRAKDEFLALLGHELRNPLSAVRNAVTSAIFDASSRERALEIASRQAEHLSRLVDDLLDVARVTQGKIRLRRDAVVLRDVVDRAIEAAHALIESRGHRFTVACAPGAAIEVDPARLEQVIGNLLTNAAKYTPPGGNIQLTCEQGREIVVRVKDDGIGISAELLPRIFDLFSQGESRLDRGQGGLGIGLTVVRRLVELHGGQIEARSDGPGRGSEFIVRLPRFVAADRKAARPSASTSTVSGVRVLVVDDDPDAAESLQLLLEALGHRVTMAYDGPAAIEAASREPPDIAIIDIGLPGMDGYEVVRTLRARPGMEKTSLVALSGYGREADKVRAFVAGFHVHLTKPVGVDRLQGLMAELSFERGYGESE